MMYEGAIRFLDRAAVAHESGAKAQFTHLLGRADAIVNELRCSLDHSHDAELGKKLDQLYEFVQNRIAGAVVAQGTSEIAAARRVLATLLEGWVDVELTTGASRPEGTA
jgi:flagellar protein FliS